MDKKQRFAIETLVPRLLGDALYQVISYYLKKDINEMKETIKIDNLVMTSIESRILAKEHVFQEIMKTTKFRDMVLHSLGKVNKNKVDIVATLLVKYELEYSENSTLMHDCLSKEFDIAIMFIKNSIKDGDYNVIYQKPTEALPTVQ